MFLAPAFLLGLIAIGVPLWLHRVARANPTHHPFASLMLLSWAYARAEAQYLAPVEYTAFIWAATFGVLIFAEPVRPLTVFGAAMIVLACLFAARRSRATDPATGV